MTLHDLTGHDKKGRVSSGPDLQGVDQIVFQLRFMREMLQLFQTYRKRVSLIHRLIRKRLLLVQANREGLSLVPT